MTFNEHNKRNFRDITPYVELGMNNVIQIRSHDGQGSFVLDTIKLLSLSEKAQDVVKQLADAPFLTKMEIFMLCETFGKGPKIFRPTAYQLFMLEKMKLNVERRDFNSPFKTIVVELPKEYIEARSPDNEKLCFSKLHFEKEHGFFMHNAVYSDTLYQSWAALDQNKEIEEWFSSFDHDNVEHVSSLPWTEQQQATEHLVRRAVLNYCLLLDETGVKRQAAESPNEYSQLVKWCAKNNKHTERNKLSLQGQPIIYKMAKEPTALVRIVDSSDKLPPVEVGRSVSPHSRRGHYRMQACGVGRTDRKRLRIPACIINKHLLTVPCESRYTT